MSFIPGESGGIASIGSLTGSGVSITTQNDVDYLALNLVAGTNISITPSLVDTSITISASGGGGGISAVNSTTGSGITATTVGSSVSLSSALVAGTGVSLVPATLGTNLTINNTKTLSASNGSGITLTPTGDDTNVSTNLVQGNGIQITSSGLNTSKTITNSGVLQITAGTGVSVNQGTGNVQVSNTGLLGLTSSNAGIGITITGTPTNPIITGLSSSGFVPYTGATQNVNLGNNNISAQDVTSIGAFRTKTFNYGNMGTAGLYGLRLYYPSGGITFPSGNQTVTIWEFNPSILVASTYILHCNTGEGNNGMVLLSWATGGAIGVLSIFAGSMTGGNLSIANNNSALVSLQYVYSGHAQTGQGFCTLQQLVVS